ncbi:MAG: ribonuclease D [Rhodothalassiaceae bacterium]
MTLIADTDALAALCRRLHGVEAVTVDTEFMRDTTYYPKLCLIQIADAEGAYAIDPLAEGIDLAPFHALMADRSVLKIFHACRQDMEIFYHATGTLPQPVFDTQVAAMVCGFGEQVGYETLVREIAKVRLDKTARFTDWSRRPLSDRQLHYALGDVTHLREVHAHLAARLKASGRESWLAEEMAILTAIDTYRLEPEDAWKRIKTRTTSPRFLARLKAVAKWREEQAQARNVPRARIAKDDVLLELAAHPPKSAEGLSEVRGLSRGFHQSAAGRALFAALAEAEALPDASLPRPPKSERVPEPPPPVAELLKMLLRIRCQETGVAAKLVASASDIEAIARDDDADVPALKGWRLSLFGRDALALKSGRIALTANGREVEIVEIESEDAED